MPALVRAAFTLWDGPRIIGAKPVQRTPLLMSESSPGLNAYWLAEAVRLHELEAGASAQTTNHSPPLAQDADKPTQIRWLLARAHKIGEPLGLLKAVSAWRRNARLIFLILVVLALSSGAMAALGFFGDERRAVNVIWTLLGLIGLPVLTLLLWIISLVVGRRAGGGVAGRAWLWLAGHWPRALKSAETGADGRVAEALAALMNRSGIGPWWLGFITHTFWLLALSATLIAMLLALSLRSYGFVLETTILSPEVFGSFVRGFGALPARLGFAIPDADMVLTALAGDVAGQSEVARRAWSSWLSGGVLVYALLPRLVVWSFTILRLFSLRAKLKPDPALPGYSDLLAREARRSAPGIVDGAAALGSDPQVAPIHTVPDKHAALIGIELHSDIKWPPFDTQIAGASLRVFDVVETREQRRVVRADLLAKSPRRLVVVCDTRVSPDRGTQNWLADISHNAGELRVWLIGADAEHNERRKVWLDNLAAIGLEGERVFTDRQMAEDWLFNHD